MDLIDGLKPGEVAVLACHGPTDVIAPWGELLSTAARARGAAGCVTDGLVRDIARIRAMRFPVFHGGIGPLDPARAAPKWWRRTPPCPWRDPHCGRRLDPGRRRRRCGGAGRSTRGAVFRAALDKIQAEDTTRAELEAGDTLRAVFARHGVL